MNHTKEIANHIRQIHVGGNWTSSNLKDNLANINWEQANRTVSSCNSIATLVYHMNYYIAAVLKVLQGGPLEASDKFSFNLPPISSQDDWEKLVDKALTDAEIFAGLVEQLSDSILGEIFVDEKYGTYYRNLQGIIEHCHYHLGQIAIVKKILLKNENK